MKKPIIQDKVDHGMHGAAGELMWLWEKSLLPRLAKSTGVLECDKDHPGQIYLLLNTAAQEPKRLLIQKSMPLVGTFQPLSVMPVPFGFRWLAKGMFERQVEKNALQV